MKSKFLALAVTSAMLALFVLPSAFSATTTATPDVQAEVGTGQLLLTAAGQYATSNISLTAGTSLDTPPLSTVTASFTSSATGDTFDVLDSTDTDGYRIDVEMESSASGDFSYSGASVGQASIPVTNFEICADFTDGTSSEKTATVGSTSAATYNLSDSGSHGSVGTSNFSFSSSFTGSDYCLTMSDSAQRYASSNAAAVNTGTYKMRRLKLDVPGGSNAGTYKSTLLITAVDGT